MGDEDDDGNHCVWIGKIESNVFDESKECTSILCSFAGYDENWYWVPAIYGNQWIIYQPNSDILLQPKYKDLFYKPNYDESKDLLAASKEYLSDLSATDNENEPYRLSKT